MISIVLVGLLTLSTILVTYQPPTASAAKRAVILSPLSWLYPIGYLGRLTSYLNSAGFTVDLIENQLVTVELFKHHLSDYNVIIWRTEAYEWNHKVFWYLGEFASPTSNDVYKDDIAAGRMDFHGFAAGIKWDFIAYYYGSSGLAGRLVYILASRSLDIGFGFLQAGAKDVIGYFGSISLQWGFGDFVTRLLFSYLSQGLTVDAAVNKTIDFFTKMKLESQIDIVVIPPLYYTGDGSATLSSLTLSYSGFV